MNRKERKKQLYRRLVGILVLTVLLLGEIIALFGVYECYRQVEKIMDISEMNKTICIYDRPSIAVQAVDVEKEVDLNEYSTFVYEISEQYDFCPELVLAIIEMESNGDANAVSSSGCIGLMQIKPGFAKERMDRLGVTDLFDPYSNILVGVDILAELVEKYEDLPTVLMCYNEGEYSGAVKQAESGDYSTYAKKIMQRTEELEEDAGKKEY